MIIGTTHTRPHVLLSLDQTRVSHDSRAWNAVGEMEGRHGSEQDTVPIAQMAGWWRWGQAIITVLCLSIRTAVTRHRACEVSSMGPLHLPLSLWRQRTHLSPCSRLGGSDAAQSLITAHSEGPISLSLGEKVGAYCGRRHQCIYTTDVKYLRLWEINFQRISAPNHARGWHTTNYKAIKDSFRCISGPF